MIRFDNTQALWLPAGSVRALMALTATAGYMAGWVELELIMLAWGFYFGQKTARPLA